MAAELVLSFICLFQAYEVLYLTNNKRVLYDLGLEPEQVTNYRTHLYF
jgi:hypothetical protein